MERQADQLAAEAARTLDRAREVGDQLSLFGPPVPVAEGDQGGGEGGRRIGRPPGARNKVKAQLRELMAVQGWRDPAQQLAYLAGLNSREDPFLVALGRAEALVAATEDRGSGEDPVERAERLLEKASGSEERKIAMRALAAAEEREAGRAERVVSLTGAILREMRQAADSLMPYVFGKVTPDLVDNRAQMLVQVMAGTGGEGAARAIGARLGPPPMPSQTFEGNQGLGDGHAGQSDGAQSDGGAA